MENVNMKDMVLMKRRWKIEKINNCDACGLNGTCSHNKAYAVENFEHNVLLNEGINELFTILCSSGGTKFDNSNAYLGVGDSSTAESAAHTGLQAATNKLYKAMDVSFPTYGTSQKATWQATFGGSDANWAWNEFTVANGSSDSAKNLNRKISSQGTKTAGQTWVLTLEITIA